MNKKEKKILDSQEWESSDGNFTLISTRKYNALKAQSRWSRFPRTWDAIIANMQAALAIMSIKAGVLAIEAAQRAHSIGHTLGYAETK